MKINQLIKSPLFRYIAPLVAFLLLGGVQSLAGYDPAVWALYGVKITLVGLLLAVLFKGHGHEIEGKPGDWRAVLLGLAVAAVWIGHYALFVPEDMEPVFNPEGLTPLAQAVGMLMRVIGTALVVPVMEELFFRSFLTRCIIREDFLKVPLGAYTPGSFWVTAIAFMLVHAMWQWPVAALAGVAYGWYLVKTKNLWGCIVAHGVTNLAISLYAIATDNWGLWG